MRVPVFILSLLGLLAGCSSYDTVVEPVVRVDGDSTLVPASTLLGKLGAAAQAPTDEGGFDLDAIRLYVPSTIRMSCSELRALLFQFRIGLEIEREGDAIKRIAARPPLPEEITRMPTTPLVSGSDSVAISFYPLANPDHLVPAFDSARGAQRRLQGGGDAVCLWGAPPLLIVQDSRTNLQEIMKNITRTYPTPPPPATGAGTDTVIPFSLLTRVQFYGLE